MGMLATLWLHVTGYGLASVNVKSILICVASLYSFLQLFVLSSTSVIHYPNGAFGSSDVYMLTFPLSVELPVLSLAGYK